MAISGKIEPMTNLRDSLKYKPVELTFGTSGLRGLVSDMTDLECYINTLGFIRFLEKFDGIDKRSIIPLSGDLRTSTPRIIKTCMRAIVDAGYKPQYCGLIPTPALALWAQSSRQAAVMVTGSHIPADRNGIKFYKPDGEVLKKDESNIKQSVADVRQEIYTQDPEYSIFDSNGMLVEAEMPEIETQAGEKFLSRYKDMFDTKFLSGKQVVVYQHSGVGRDLLVKIAEHLGAKVEAVDRSETFVPIDTENVTPENQSYFKSLADKYPGSFAIISADGDGDRPFVIDENGEFHRGDVLGFVVAREINAEFAALPVSSSDAVDKSLDAANIAWKHTAIGSPYVIEAMSRASDKLAVGWEVNGGFLVGDDFAFEGKRVEKLPTRDSFLPIFIALRAACNRNVSISEMFGELPSRFTQAGLIDNFPNDISKKITSLFDDPEAGRKLIENALSSEKGFGKLTDKNTTDGLRLFFDNGDIAHIRPSGNAPQLRIYSVADSQKRADEIVEMCLGGDGILRQLQKAVTVAS